MSGQWIDGETLTSSNYNDNFITQLAECIASLHTSEVGIEGNRLVHHIVEYLDPVDDFTQTACKEFWDIEENLYYNTILHGDIWAGNIIVDPKGNFAGLIDWNNKQVGDAHWDLRTIRRWIGWRGLDSLINKYNSLTGCNKLNKDYIVILDKISLCHSRQLHNFRKSVFTDYIKRYPNAI